MINEMLLMGFILGLVAHDVYPEVKGRLKRLLTEIPADLEALLLRMLGVLTM